MKILITGICGFAGSHLAEYLLTLAPDIQIFGTARPKSNTENIQDFIGKIYLVPCDITKIDEVKGVVKKTRPDIIFHLAAQSYIHSSWENPSDTLSTNIIGQNNLFEAVRAAGYNPKIVIACSSEEYGFVEPKDLPVKETQELRPRSPYALSKAAQDLMGFQYWISYGLNVIRIRAFNHTGPRRPNVFGISGFGNILAQMEKKKIPPQITTRDLTAVRDFTDVRDVVRGYYLASQQCMSGEVYNLCSGRGLKIQDILDEFLKLSSVKDIKIVSDVKQKRPNDGGILYGDNTKFVTATGWKIQYDFFKRTVPDILEYWRKRV